jgi:pimeloyl-ACP methyl ester carboxylesterase
VSTPAPVPSARALLERVRPALPEDPGLSVRTSGDGIELEYEVFGDRADPAVLLIAGYAMQLISWDAALCEMLAMRGFFVVRFDNRDCGHSTLLDTGPFDVVSAIVDRLAGREPPPVPYTLLDMANDGFAVLDALEVQRAHVVGASMGAVIAQLMAIERPDRVVTLVSIMAGTGEPEYGQGSPETLAALFGPPPSTRDEYVEHMVRIAKEAGTKSHYDEQRTRARAGAAFDRAFCPEGSTRQFAALSCASSREAQLRALTVATLVIHGVQDTLVAPSGGERTAELVPGAQLLILEEAGHDLPPVVWPRVVDAIARHALAAADAAQAG